jgi:hypothetical protein
MYDAALVMPGYFFEFTATDPVNGLSTTVKVPVTVEVCT